MGELDEFYRNKEKNEKDAYDLLDRRRMELWSKLIAEIIPEKIHLLIAEKQPHIQWVDTGSEVVVSWSLTHSSDDYTVNLFQDGRLGSVDMTRKYGSSYEDASRLSRWYGGKYPTDGMDYFVLSKVIHAFLATGPFVRETDLFQGCMDGYWDKPEVRESLMRRFYVA